MASVEVTEGRLRAALQRLLDGKPDRIKKGGKLSLNKINNEAGLGHSYIHKFKNFVENEANPAIEEFNKNYDPVVEKLKSEVTEDLSEVEKLRAKLKKEKALKDQYRNELDNAKQINKMLEQQNSSLMFRVYELQEEVRLNNVVNLASNNPNT
jgi:predicted RNase H-like nuclease (RuvC/YqgF family)